MTLTKVHVISLQGKLVATYIPQPQPKKSRRRSKGKQLPYTSPVLGPGHKLHKVEIENAEAYYNEGRSPELHAIVQKKLRLK